MSDPSYIQNSTPFDLIAEDANTWLSEAENFADGEPVENQGQADAVGLIIDGLNKSAQAAEKARKEEVRPFDDGKKAIQEKYAPLFADPKTKSPGRVYRAIDALKATVKPYLDKLERERLEKVEEARKAAAKAAEEAAEAARAAQASDLAAQEAAEAKIAEAKAMESAAKSLETSRVQLHGGERAKGLRKTWTPVLSDPKAALIHYIAQRPDDVKAVLLGWAKSDVANGARKLPGFDIIEGTTL